MKSLVIALVLIILLFGGIMIPIGSSTHVHSTPVKFHKTALLELFTGTWCQYCPGAEGATYRLLKNYTLNQLAVIEYHYNDNYSSVPSSVRLDFYNVVGFPQAFFNGENSTVGGDTNPMSNEIYNNYKSKVDAALNQTSTVALSMTTSLNNDSLSVNVYVTTSQKPKLQNLSLGVILVYDENRTEVDNGRTYYLRFTSLEWLSNAPIRLGNHSVIIKHYETTLNEKWDKSKLYVVSFIQTRDKHKVTEGTDTWYEAEVLNSAIKPIQSWEIIPEDSVSEVDINEAYVLNTTVVNQLPMEKVIRVGFDTSTVPEGWNVSIEVNGKVYDNASINLTLDPGQQVKVHFIVTPTTPDTAYLKIYAQDGVKYTNIHYVIIDTTGEVPEININYLAPMMVGIALLVAFSKKKF